MEVEIKIRLQEEKHIAAFEAALGVDRMSVEDQENVFFDGVHRELIKEKLVFRIRIIQRGDAGVQPVVGVVALKGNAVLVDGIAHVEEEEEQIDVQIARSLINDPSLIPEAAKAHRLLQKIVNRVHCPDGYTHMGRFRTVRSKYSWQEYTVEVDRTTYPFGVALEVEVESTDPERARDQITGVLTANNIPFGYSQRNKFENMLLGSVL